MTVVDVVIADINPTGLKYLTNVIVVQNLV